MQSISWLDEAAEKWDVVDIFLNSVDNVIAIPFKSSDRLCFVPQTFNTPFVILLAFVNSVLSKFSCTIARLTV